MIDERQQLKNIGGISWYYPWYMDDTELYGYVRYVLDNHKDQVPLLEAVVITISGPSGSDDEILLKYIYKNCNFERVRRITGYLAEEKRWNSAKKAELEDRVAHAEV